VDGNRKPFEQVRPFTLTRDGPSLRCVRMRSGERNGSRERPCAASAHDNEALQKTPDMGASFTRPASCARQPRAFHPHDRRPRRAGRKPLLRIAPVASPTRASTWLTSLRTVMPSSLSGAIPAEVYRPAVLHFPASLEPTRHSSHSCRVG
jgi:hypothetical protein